MMPSSKFFSFMHSLLLFSLFNLIFMSHFTSFAQALCHDDERSSLLQFKDSLIINKSVCHDSSAYSKVISWKVEDCCSWDGVTCNEVTGHLIKLDLTGSCLYGYINSTSTLFHLVHLEWLNLADNDFNGSEIPSGLINLSMLSYLNLSDSSFSGQIPWEILELSKLETLDISYNHNMKLQKPGLKSLVEKLTHLKELALDEVNIFSSVPHILANFYSLTKLSLSECELQGEFPVKIFQLPNLRYIDVVGNENLSGYLPKFEKSNPLQYLLLERTRFSGEIPYSIGNLRSLAYLDMSKCVFSGSIPSSLGNLSSLESLALGHNNFSSQDSGSLSWIAKCSKLINLGLSNINIVGEFPSWLMNLTHLTVLLMGYNNLNGPFPSEIRNLMQLSVLDLGSNQLQGLFPSVLYDLKNLQWLDVGSNNLSGKLPQNLLNGTNLRMIDLSHNQFQGRIPRSLASSTKLEFLNLGNNQIRDTFPSWLETLPKLKVLILQSNRLKGAIKEPETNYVFPELRIIDFSHNRFTGNLPSKFFQFWNATKAVNESPLPYLGTETFLKTGETVRLGIRSHVPMDYGYSLQMSTKGIDLEYGKIPSLLTAILFSDNKFEGEIPTSIANLRGLRFLNLSNNNLKGPTPAAMGKLTELESLDLSNNKLSGQIPQQLVDLTFLSYFNVSNNHLTGRIPQGKQFDTFENISFDDNPGLCGKQIAKNCEDFKPSKNIEEDPAGSKFPFEFGWKIILIGFASGLVTGVALEHAYSARKKAHRNRM